MNAFVNELLLGLIIYLSLEKGKDCVKIFIVAAKDLIVRHEILMEAFGDEEVTFNEEKVR